MPHIDVEITNECNLACIHCSAEANKGGAELSEQEIRTILGNAREIGLSNVGFTGGEPFQKKMKLQALLRYCKEILGTKTHLHTNGTLLEPQDISWLGELVDELTVTVFGSCPRTHDKITKVDGSFEATMLGLERLSGNHGNVKVFIIPMKSNYAEIPQIIEEVIELGYRNIRLLSLSPTGRAVDNYTSLCLNEDQRNWLSTTLNRMNRDLDVDILAGFCTRLSFPRLDKLPSHDSCLAAENRVHIDAFGEVYPCTASSGWDLLSAGNLRGFEYDISKIWHRSPLFQFIRHMHAHPSNRCSNCGNYADCMSGCRVVEYYRQGNITAIRQNCISED